MVAVPPIFTLEGSAEHAITGGLGVLTVKLALQDATPRLLPSTPAAARC